MKDLDVREAVRKWLSRRHRSDDDTLIVEEMGIWANYVRVDVAVINGEFHGFELKSARDTLARLPRQASIYNEVFDRVTLVVAEKHFEKAKGQIPDWWGVLSANTTKHGRVSLSSKRPALLNPNISPVQVARLFWRIEAIAVLERHGLARGFRSMPVEVLAHRLAAALPLDVLKNEARAALKARNRSLRQTIANMRNVTVQ